VVQQGAGVGVAGDNRTRRGLQNVPGGAVGGVGDIDEDTEAVHLAHGIAAQASEAAARLVLPGAVAKGSAPHPGKREHAQAERMKQA